MKRGVQGRVVKGRERNKERSERAKEKKEADLERRRGVVALEAIM